jgi:uncharacterized FlaG/YvyC family protein
MKMSNIDAVQRNPLLNTQLYAGLNEAAPAWKNEDVPKVDPVKSINQPVLLGDRREIKPGVDEETDRLVLQVVDKDTKEVIYQAPPEITLQMAREMRQRQKHSGTKST